MRVFPSRTWRSTFSTTTMASSTTSPTERTIARIVSRLRLKPKAYITIPAPISETGIATSGTSAVRTDPMNRNTTRPTMRTVSMSVNLLTILAIVLSVGLVVDDAIVVVENVERHVREGRTRLQAAIIGARELVGPIIAMTITLAAVYAPIGFQGGLTGSLFLEFAITLAAAVVVSGIVAITLSPVMSSRFVHAQGQEGWLTKLVNHAFETGRNTYARMLDGGLQVRL